MKLYSNMRIIRMKEFWDYNNTHLVIEPTGRISEMGLHRYWMSIDSAIRFNINKREQYLKRKVFAEAKKDKQRDAYHRQADFNDKQHPKDRMYAFFKKHQHGQSNKYKWTNKDVNSSRRLPKI